MPLRFALGLHDHQPVGNFDSVFAQAYADGYAPFLALVTRFPTLRFSIHLSGPLLEWLEVHRPEHLQQLRRAVERGQAEILGGAYYEPILTMLPRRDRVGQIRRYADKLQQVFGVRPRGLWLAERVWEPSLVSDLVEAGVEFTLLDDHHFRQAGLPADALHGYYLTDDQGALLRVFPISESMRYFVPWRLPPEGMQYLLDLAERQTDALVVCADDGEKFGVWPGTHRLCYTDGWLEKFFALLVEHAASIRCVTLSQALEETEPVGPIYLPDCSYREMTEWALPAERYTALRDISKELETLPFGQEAKGLLRGGLWRNFAVKYPEVREMTARMLEVSQRVADSGNDAGVLDLYRGQCNCPYWHGAFGGLYLPHLRHAIYQHLIAAEDATRPAPGIECRDFNLDGFPEYKLTSPKLAAYFAPQRGGMLYELDVRSHRVNVLATLARRPEVYHADILATARGEEEAASSVTPGASARFKQAHLDQALIYDATPRKSLLDHFFSPDTRFAEVVGQTAEEWGDAVTGAYTATRLSQPDGECLVLRRRVHVRGRLVNLTKVIAFTPNGDGLTVDYTLTDLPAAQPLRFAVEFNFAGLAAGQPDRFYYYDGVDRAGPLETLLDLPAVGRIGLVDGWRRLDLSVSWTQPGGLWAYPIQTVSQSEGGFELVYQSSAVLPHWLIPAGTGAWSVRLTWRCQPWEA